MKLSTIFSNAADYHLSCDTKGYHLVGMQSEYTCYATKKAINYSHVSISKKEKLMLEAKYFAEEVSEKHGNEGVWFFSDEFSDEYEKQATRYLWLKFLSLYAKDQGV